MGSNRQNPIFRKQPMRTTHTMWQSYSRVRGQQQQHLLGQNFWQNAMHDKERKAATHSERLSRSSSIHVHKYGVDDDESVELSALSAASTRPKIWPNFVKTALIATYQDCCVRARMDEIVYSQNCVPTPKNVSSGVPEHNCIKQNFGEGNALFKITPDVGILPVLKPHMEPCCPSDSNQHSTHSLVRWARDVGGQSHLPLLVPSSPKFAALHKLSMFFVVDATHTFSV